MSKRPSYLPPALRALLVAAGAAFLSSCEKADESLKESQVVAATDMQQASMSAHWITSSLMLLPPKTSGVVKLERLVPGASGFEVAESVVLTPAPNSQWSNFPHLRDWTAYSVPLSSDQAKQWLKSALLITFTEEKRQRIALPQVPGILDALYTSGETDADEFTQFGAIPKAQDVSFALWAPTATSVSVRLYDQDKQLLKTEAMEEDSATGIWQIDSKVKLGLFYRFQIEVFHPESRRFETLEVTDPYSLSLSTDSRFSQIINLHADELKPEGWDTQEVVPLSHPESLVIYETHIGDFSGTDETVAPDLRGKYAAFSQDSDGTKHLKALRDAGLNTIHLLPTYDLGSINEFSDQQIRMSDPMAKVCDLVPDSAACYALADDTISLQSYLASLDKTGSEAQALIESIDEFDDYNWGYDPYHYTVPEGSYATEPEGSARILEFRQMVRQLHQMGFRVVMDVVYNHTFKAGLQQKSVLDKVVPGYYHRLDPLSGNIEQSTCCDNTATEHAMMAKLMTDSLLVWSKEYRIDGFRFDLMGHQPKEVMLHARKAVKAIDPDTYFYGEGWNFGEVANNARFVQASQLELGGTEIGTFTDRLRDAVRGGTDFDSGDALRAGQGFSSGLGLYPNERTATSGDQEQRYQTMLQWLRLGMAGNLANFVLIDSAGQQVLGKNIDYNGQPAGYALDPADTINYVSKHDNQTLWDAIQYRLPADYSSQERTRLQVMSLAYPLLSQGIPFLHMGSDLLRSKSFLRDSFNYGHWFNRVDFSGQSNNYGVGLPPAAKDEANWPMISNLLQQNEGRDVVTPQLIQQSASVFQDFLRIRASSVLFSLRNQQQVIDRVAFHNMGPDHVKGVILMSISDGEKLGGDLDPVRDELLVAINMNREAVSLPFIASNGLQLHQAQQQGSDETVKAAVVRDGFITIPALTTAVFER